MISYIRYYLTVLSFALLSGTYVAPVFADDLLHLLPQPWLVDLRVGGALGGAGRPPVEEIDGAAARGAEQQGDGDQQASHGRGF